MVKGSSLSYTNWVILKQSISIEALYLQPWYMQNFQSQEAINMQNIKISSWIFHERQDCACVMPKLKMMLQHSYKLAPSTEFRPLNILSNIGELVISLSLSLPENMSFLWYCMRQVSKEAYVPGAEPMVNSVC